MIHTRFRLFLILIMALALSILPMPVWLNGFRPQWVLLVVLYIQFFMPTFFNISFLLIVGLSLDVLLSTVLGEHAFALLLVSWIAAKKARRFNFFPPGQQILLILFLCLIYQLVIFLTDAFLGYYPKPLLTAINTITSMLLWPWVRLLIDSCVTRSAKI